MAGSRVYVRILVLSVAGVFELTGLATTTHEKDGSLISLRFNDTSTRDSAFPLAGLTATLPNETSRSYPINDNAVYVSNMALTGFGLASSTTFLCLTDTCQQLQENTDSFSITTNGTWTRITNLAASYTRFATEAEWRQALLQDYDDRGVTAANRLPLGRDLCSIGVCVTEAEWCKTDPNCSESPYQEPPASVKPGAIAGFVIAGFVVLVAVLYTIHLYLVIQQAKRYRTLFAKRIADTIDVSGSARSLSPDALAKEFDAIDAGIKDGKLSKEELWDFISTGKAGEIEKRDFEALFAAIDLDKNGTVDFLEFCAFMGKCSDEYRNARVNRGSVVARSSHFSTMEE